MAAAEDPYGKAITSAICTGLGKIADPNAGADDPSITTPESWHTFFINELSQVILKSTPLKAITAKVDSVTNAANLATINPRLAYTYYRECGGK
jgi:hypothetical protein